MTTRSPETPGPRRAAGVPGATTDSGDAVRHRIFATAATLFRTKGYAQSTTRELATMLGLKKASLYHYVTSKEDLLYAISIDSLQQIDAHVAAAIESATPPERLRALIRAHVTSALGNRDQHAVMLSELGSLSEEPRKEVIKARDAYEKRIRDVIQAERAEQRLRTDIDAKYLALSLLNMLNWTIFWYQPGGSLTPEELAGILATIFIEGASAPRAVPPDAGRVPGTGD
jgi:AcrR family transcriptional regulator